jgi:hypothetical protein
MIDDLVAFIAARLDEDSEFLDDFTQPAAMQERRANRQPVHVGGFSDQRMLREVAAKRARLALMIEAHADMDRLLADDTAGDVARAMAIGRARAASVGAKHDAAVHSDHPDYRQKWAP